MSNRLIIQQMQRPREITFRFLTETSDQNIYGRVHGGNVMKWIDQTAYACAAGWCKTQCVTVYVGGIRFSKPIPVGSIVELHARLIHTGTTSMHIKVDVSAENPLTHAAERTTSCVIVFAAIDAAGNKAPVPAWVPGSDEDKAWSTYAQRMMTLRKQIEDELAHTVSA
jgi:acyl-CoA hydrolase